MAIELSRLDEWEVWVPPEERGFYESDPDEATTMELRFLTKERRDHYRRLAKKYERVGAVSSADQKAMRALFADHIRDIRNLTIGGVPVTDGGDLFDIAGFDSMQAAVTLALMQRSSLEAGLAKKLKPASASSHSPQSRSEAGGAAGVIQASPLTTPEAPASQATSVYPTPQNGPSADATPVPAPSITNGLLT